MAYDALARQPDAEWVGHAPHEEFRRETRPLEPGDDPFYQPPQGYQRAAPGTVLRSREVELAFLGWIPQRVAATQLLYRTSDKDGAPQATVTTVLVPAQRDAKHSCPVLSYQCAIDATAGRCFPSYSLRRHAKAAGSFSQLEFLLIAAALAEGWAVSVPDHEGPYGYWGAPYEPGYCVLDGIRAALSTDRLELLPHAPVGLWGYSGGGLATGWAAEVAADYAPDLNIVGAVLGSPVGDLGGTFRRLNGTLFSGLPAMVVAALSHVYPDLDRVIDQHTTAEGRALLDSLEKMTTGGALVHMHHKSIDDYIDGSLDDVLAKPEVQHVFEDTKLGTTVPTPPVLVIQARYDQVISVDHVDSLVETYAAGGASVTYHRDLLSEHILLHPLSAPLALRWLANRFAGRPAPRHLLRTQWPVVLNPKTYLGLMQLGAVTAKVVTDGVLRHLRR